MSESTPLENIGQMHKAFELHFDRVNEMSAVGAALDMYFDAVFNSNTVDPDFAQTIRTVILFHAAPGSGKSSAIKHILRVLNAKDYANAKSFAVAALKSSNVHALQRELVKERAEINLSVTSIQSICRSATALKSVFSCVIVDEAQDVSSNESVEAVLQTISPGGHLVLLGDPYQHLGLSPDGLDLFCALSENEKGFLIQKVKPISKTFRCPHDIVTLAGKIIAFSTPSRSSSAAVIGCEPLTVRNPLRCFRKRRNFWKTREDPVFNGNLIVCFDEESTVDTLLQLSECNIRVSLCMAPTRMETLRLELQALANALQNKSSVDSFIEAAFTDKERAPMYLREFVDLSDWVRAFRNRSATDIVTILNLMDDDYASGGSVVCGTVFDTKGASSEHVYLADLENLAISAFKLILRSANSQSTVPRGDERAFLDRLATELLNVIRNMLFVAVTRSKKELTVLVSGDPCPVQQAIAQRFARLPSKQSIEKEIIDWLKRRNQLGLVLQNEEKRDTLLGIEGPQGVPSSSSHASPNQNSQPLNAEAASDIARKFYDDFKKIRNDKFERRSSLGATSGSKRTLSEVEEAVNDE